MRAASPTMEVDLGGHPLHGRSSWRVGRRVGRAAVVPTGGHSLPATVAAWASTVSVVLFAAGGGVADTENAMAILGGGFDYERGVVFSK